MSFESTLNMTFVCILLFVLNLQSATADPDAIKCNSQFSQGSGGTGVSGYQVCNNDQPPYGDGRGTCNNQDEICIVTNCATLSSNGFCDKCKPGYQTEFFVNQNPVDWVVCKSRGCTCGQCDPPSTGCSAKPKPPPCQANYYYKQNPGECTPCPSDRPSSPPGSVKESDCELICDANQS